MRNRFSFKKAFHLLALSSIVLLTSCDDAKNDIIDDNRVYFKDASVNKFEDIFLENVDTKVALPINLTQKANRDVKITINHSEEALKAFNEKYDKEYVLYPTQQWNLDSEQVVVSEGTSVASLGLTIRPLTEELKATGAIYAIPVNIASAEGAGIFNNSSTLIYVLKQVPYADVPVVTGSNNVKFGWTDNPTALNDFTVEFMMNLDEWRNGNNKTLIQAPGTSGRQIYTRLENGGSGLKNADFEVNFGGGIYLNSRPASGAFELNRWYHMAFVVQAGKLVVYIDGIVVAQREVPNASLDVDFSQGSFGGNGLNKTMLGELRVWTVARSQGQIKESMYSVNPQTEGLAAYWKLNEGTGNTYKDFTTKNPDATSTNDPEWRLNERLEIQ